MELTIPQKNACGILHAIESGIKYGVTWSVKWQPKRKRFEVAFGGFKGEDEILSDAVFLAVRRYELDYLETA